MGHICIKYENKLYPMTNTYQLWSVYPQQREVQPNHFLPGQQNNWFWTGHFYSQGLLSGGSKIWKPNRVAKNSQVLASYILILRYQNQHQHLVIGYFHRDINLNFTSCRSGVSLHTNLTIRYIQLQLHTYRLQPTALSLIYMHLLGKRVWYTLRYPNFT